MFILVTLTTNDENIVLNANAIQTIEQSPGGSTIYFSDGDCIEVEQKVEQLYDILRERR